jgi:hypothetical protein
MGDDWERKIRRGIETCSLFLPIISQRALSEENRRSYFWEEWNRANEFKKAMAPDETFIIPVVIDDTKMDRFALPESFLKAQARWLPGGNVTSDMTESLKQLVRDYHRRKRAE